jgi:hypothetical protein
MEVLSRSCARPVRCGGRKIFGEVLQSRRMQYEHVTEGRNAHLDYLRRGCDRVCRCRDIILAVLYYHLIVWRLGCRAAVGAKVAV